LDTTSTTAIMTGLTRTLLVGAALAGAAGCASSGTAGQASDPQTSAASSPAPRQRRDPNVITEVELAARSTLTARQAIEQLRPQFLRVRGTTTLGNAQTGDVIWVYVDGTRMGTVDVLNGIGVHEVREIRYLSPSEATNRYGTGHVQGAILVTRK
jgi:type IV pilus biogenesis protein CpaD/CtpE